MRTDGAQTSRWSEAVVSAATNHHRASDLDPALLAFVKCHISSFLRWDLLRLLSDDHRRWREAAELARELQRPAEAVASTLEQLVEEGIVEARRAPSGAAIYRLDPLSPSTRVVERLLSMATRSQELRQIIVARVVQGTPSAARP